MFRMISRVNNPWMVGSNRVIKGALEDVQLRRLKLEDVGKKIGVSKIDDWYNFSTTDVVQNGGSGVMRYYKNNLYAALKHLYSSHNWEPWKFPTTPRGIISGNRDEQLRLMRSVESHLDIKEAEDWYKVSTLTLKDIPGGANLLYMFNRSVHEICTSLKPEHNWLPWKFESVPRKFWRDTKNVRAYLDWLGPQLGVKKMEDWYNVTSVDLKKHKAASLLVLIADSVYGILEKAYPEYNWEPWKFGTVPKRFWDKVENQRMYLDWVYKSKNFSSFEDWYKMSGMDLVRMGAGRLLSRYNSSIYKLLSTAYPEYPWKESLFPAVRARFWEDPANVMQFLNVVAEKLSIQQLDDWYRVSFLQFQDIGGSSLLRKYGSISEILKTFYPHHNWELNKFQSKHKKAAQRWLSLAVQKLFSGLEVMEDYDHPEARFEQTKVSVELDVYIPEVGLALEYQGQQHFGDVHYFGPHRQYNKRDVEKRRICEQHNITLIEVPYWWNRQVGSLAATIAKHRPDLDKTYQLTKRGAEPIPETKPIKVPTARRTKPASAKIDSSLTIHHSR